MKKKTLRIIPLGGLGEVGKNMTVFEYGRQNFARRRRDYVLWLT